MLKSIIMTGTALALSAAACILPPVCIDEALANPHRSTSTRSTLTLYRAISTITWPR